jgi:ribosomal protein L37AE/L43A
MKHSKSRNDKDTWCPVCRTPALRQTSVRRDWKCRECGSRIPDQTLMRLIVDRVEIIRLNAEAAKAETS